MDLIMSRGPLRVVNWIFPIFVAVLTTLVFFFNMNNVQSYLMNSDSLYGIEIVRDFVESPISIHNWLVPQAPFVFPDLFLIFPGVILGTSPYNIFLLTLLLQTLITVFLLRGIASLLIKDINPHFVDGLILVMLIAGIVYPEPARLVFSLEWHHGNSIGILIMLWLILKNERNNSILLKSITVLCSFLLGLSDSFFLLQFSLPLLIVHFACRVKKKSALTSDVMVFLIALASYLGYRSLKVFFWNSPRQPIRFQIDSIVNDVPKFLQLLLEVTHQIPIFVSLTILIFTPWKTLARYIDGQIRKDSTHISFDDNRLIFISVLIRVSFALSISVICLIPSLDPGHRYVSYFFIFGVYWAGLLFYSLARNRNYSKEYFFSKPKSLVFPICYVVVTAFILSTSSPNEFRYVSAPSNSTIKCLDKQIEANDLRRGVSSYWLARYYSNFLATKPEIVSIYSDLSGFLWITNWRDYDGKFDFALVENSNQDPYKVSIESVSKIPGMVFSHDCGEVTIVFGGRFLVKIPDGF